MFFDNVNYITIVIAGIISMGIGSVWYSPLLFVKRWMKEMNYSPEEMKAKGSKEMAKTYAMGFVLSLVTAYVLSGLLNSLVVVGFDGLFCVAFSMWAGFSMPVALNNVIYGKESCALFAINSGYQLASITAITFFIGIFG